MAREIEMPILRKVLIGKDQHRVFRKGIVDSGVIGRLDRLRQIDIADLSGKTRRDRKNGDGHVFLHRVVLRIGPLCIDLCNQQSSFARALIRPMAGMQRWRITSAGCSLVTAERRD